MLLELKIKYPSSLCNFECYYAICSAPSGKHHPVQERIAKAHGSQCGFCTPGIVMSMYTLLRNLPRPSMSDLETTLQGKHHHVQERIAKAHGSQCGFCAPDIFILMSTLPRNSYTDF